MPRLWVYLGDMVPPRTGSPPSSAAPLLVYGAMEAGTIGFQCERREGFHLNIDLCAVRVADADGRTLPPGEPGHIVLSSLDNRATILLNYRIGDRGVLAQAPCPCGRSLPLLASFEGRSSEMIRLGDGHQVSSLMLEGMFRAELRRTLQAQIEQLGPGQLCWRIVPFAISTGMSCAGLCRPCGGDRAARPTVQFPGRIASTSQGQVRARSSAGMGGAGTGLTRAPSERTACRQPSPNGVIAGWPAGERAGLWREHSDRINRALLAAWLPGEPVGRVLKTDLFEEAVGEGLYPPLAPRARAVIGIDLSGTAVARAVDRHPRLRGLVTDIRALPIRSEACDVVVSTSTLDHFAHAAEIAIALRRSTGSCEASCDHHGQHAQPDPRARAAPLPPPPGVLPYRTGCPAIGRVCGGCSPRPASASATRPPSCIPRVCWPSRPPTCSTPALPLACGSPTCASSAPSKAWPLPGWPRSPVTSSPLGP
jgi:hypothetical protein